MEAAAVLADEARCMDLSDRHANSYCVKRMLQADQVPSRQHFFVPLPGLRSVALVNIFLSNRELLLH